MINILQYSKAGLLITRPRATKALGDQLTKICANTQGMQISFEQFQDVAVKSSADLFAQSWPTFGTVDRCLALRREYIDLLDLAYNSEEFCRLSSLKATIRMPVSFADTAEYDCEAAHIGARPDFKLSWPSSHVTSR
jgi:hypothetical protein